MRVEAKPQLFAQAVSVLFMASIVAVANGAQTPLILFPELGALSSDVLLRPQGKWAAEPWKLIATPTVAACFGILVSTNLPYGVLAILLATAGGIVVLKLLRSAVAPAISAGVLPVVLGISSWLYPLCILGTLVLLAGLLWMWRATQLGDLLSLDGNADRKVVEVLESKPHGRRWLPSLVLFVALIGAGAQISGWRFILFPPLIVMAYEMLGHPDTCPWAKRPYTFPVVCAAAALVGVQAVRTLGVTPLAAALVLLVTYVLLGVFRLRMPPALAIGLIPFIVAKHTYVYAYSVGIGTVSLTLWFELHRRFWNGTAKLRS